MICPRQSSDFPAAARIGAAAVPTLLIFLAACTEPDTDGALLNDRIGLDPASRAAAEAVDGLTVGHRLMESGEYELALRAYYRAGYEQGINADVLSAIGSANLRLGRLGQAERQLRNAVEKDPKFTPAWNNLGVVLTERGEYREAREIFKLAFGLDRGESEEIRDNLRLVEQKIQNIDAPEVEDTNFRLVRRGNGRYLLLGKEQ